MVAPTTSRTRNSNDLWAPYLGKTIATQWCLCLLGFSCFGVVFLLLSWGSHWRDILDSNYRSFQLQLDWVHWNRTLPLASDFHCRLRYHSKAPFASDFWSQGNRVSQGLEHRAILRGSSQNCHRNRRKLCDFGALICTVSESRRIVGLQTAVYEASRRRIRTWSEQLRLLLLSSCRVRSLVPLAAGVFIGVLYTCVLLSLTWRALTNLNPNTCAYHCFRNHYILNSSTIKVCNCNCNEFLKVPRGTPLKRVTAIP